MAEARNPVATEPGLRPQRLAMQFARQQHKSPERLRGPQHGDMRGHAGLEARTDEAGPGLGRGELVRVFQVVEEGKLHRPRLVERCEPPDLLACTGRIDQMRLGQRGNLGQRRRRWLLEECRLRHSTLRGPAGL